MLTPQLLANLRRLLDRLIPADNWPGALASGVEHYVLGQLAGNCAEELPLVATGLHQLDLEAAAGHGKDFTALTSDQQDQLISQLEFGRTLTVWPFPAAAPVFIDRMIHLAHEGFYSDPGNGGNAGGLSWQMVRFDPRLPSAQPSDLS